MEMATHPITINISKAWVTKLKELAHKEALRTGKEIAYTDLIRKALVECYPELVERAEK